MSPLSHPSSDLLLGEFAARYASPTTPVCHVSSSGLGWSAAELDTRADQVARHLHAEGYGPGDFVGVGLGRSLDLLAALLGVVKCGAAYVPLDPGYPEDRLSHMISSAGLKVVITDGKAAPLFRRAGASKILSASPEEDPPFTALRIREAGPDDPLYAIFTSGSTGQPKAAAVYRRGFANLVRWYTDELSLGPDDTTLVISSPSFDLTQKNFFAPLSTGGRIVLDDQGTYDITRLLLLIRVHGVSLINCTPSAFYPLVDAAASEEFTALASLRFVVLGGEPISIPRLRAWMEHPNCRAEVVNTYGPTECTDICAFHRLHRENLDEFPFVPLGREIPNAVITIRNEELHPVPDGEIGELCISGAGLGAGYLNDPERTARSFVEGRFYRTGDLARRLPCGTLEFRGRADHQVKVNGHRIELGEIELTLGQVESVREAVVIAAEGRLVAHVKGTAGAVELKEHLAKRLPAYMIPGEFRYHAEFPLTPNGKVDRIALARSSPEKIAVPGPNTGSDLETRILGLWSELLERPVADPEANFFDLGGTSIHLAVMHVRLKELTGREIAITDLFARPSVRSLASFLSPEGTTSASHARDRARLQRAGFSNFRRPR